MTTPKRAAKTLATLVLTVALALAAILATTPKKANAAWVKSGNAYYWRNTNGTWAKNAWVKYNGAWYYFGNDYKLTVNSWIKYNGKYYYIGSNAQVVTNNWAKAGSTWYYLGADGTIVVNDFVTYNGATYYMGDNGKPWVNTTVEMNGKVYSFGPDGKLIGTTEVPTVAETVLLDRDGVKVTVTKFNLNDMWEPSLTLRIENNTGTSIMVSAQDASVNGVMCEPTMVGEVSACETENILLKLPGKELIRHGVMNIAEIEFALSVRDMDNYGKLLFVSDPLAVQTSIAGTYTQQYDDSGNVVFDGYGIKVISKGVDYVSMYGGPSVVFEIINTADEDIFVVPYFAAVNGKAFERYYDRVVLAGKRDYRDCVLSTAELEYLGISTTISRVECSIALYDADSGDPIFESPITVTIRF